MTTTRASYSCCASLHSWTIHTFITLHRAPDGEIVPHLRQLISSTTQRDLGSMHVLQWPLDLLLGPRTTRARQYPGGSQAVVGGQGLEQCDGGGKVVHHILLRGGRLLVVTSRLQSADAGTCLSHSWDQRSSSSPW
jgi:hypothetical protein